MRYTSTQIERADRFRAALAHLSLPIVLITGAQYQNQWWLYALLLAVPLLMSALGPGPVLDRTAYPVPFVVHHVRRAVGFVFTMGIMFTGLVFVLVSWSNSEQHQREILTMMLAAEDSFFWFLTFVYWYQDMALHPLFPLAGAVLAGAILVGLLVSIRNALSALRGDLRTF